MKMPNSFFSTLILLFKNLLAFMGDCKSLFQWRTLSKSLKTHSFAKLVLLMMVLMLGVKNIFVL